MFPFRQQRRPRSGAIPADHRTKTRRQLPPIPVQGVFLALAKELLNQNKSLAIVPALTACEILAEQIVSTAFTRKGMEHLIDPIDEFVSSYSLSNEKVRKLYEALTGDEITKLPFWNQFRNLCKQRNDFVHHGKTVSKKEAEESCQVAEKMIDHLESVMRSLK